MTGSVNSKCTKSPNTQIYDAGSQVVGVGQIVKLMHLSSLLNFLNIIQVSSWENGRMKVSSYLVTKLLEWYWVQCIGCAVVDRPVLLLK